MTENKTMIDESIILLHSFLSDPYFMFNYFNRHKTNDDGKPWNIMKCQLDYQMGWLLNDQIVIASSRDAGKTSSIESTLFRVAITNPHKQSVYIVLNERHMRDIASNLDSYFNQNDFTRSFYSGYIKKDKIFYLNNGHKIHIRIVGQDLTGAKALVALHVDFMIIDEAQLLKRKLLAELLPGLNKGGKLIVAGVPNDLRDTVLYKYCADKNTIYYKYIAEETERWGEEKERKAIDSCGGKHTVLYRQLYRATWGDSLEAVFLPSKLVESIDKDVKYNYCEYHGEKFDKAITELNLPHLRSKYAFYVMGSDMGYTKRSPVYLSVLGVYQSKNKETNELEYHYDLIYRCQISGMSAYDMSKTYDYLMNYFDCKHACLDSQNYGNAIHSNLINSELFPETFRRNKKFIIPLLFADIIVTGKVTTIDHETLQEREEDLMVGVKYATTEKLSDLINSGNVHFSPDDANQSEYPTIIEILQAESSTPQSNKYHKKTYTNQISLHCTDSLRCCTYVIMQVIEKGIKHQRDLRPSVLPVKLKNTLFNPIRRRTR